MLASLNRFARHEERAVLLIWGGKQHCPRKVDHTRFEEARDATKRSCRAAGPVWAVYSSAESDGPRFRLIPPTAERKSVSQPPAGDGLAFNGDTTTISPVQSSDSPKPLPHSAATRTSAQGKFSLQVPSGQTSQVPQTETGPFPGAGLSRSSQQLLMGLNGRSSPSSSSSISDRAQYAVWICLQSPGMGHFNGEPCVRNSDRSVRHATDSVTNDPVVLVSQHWCTWALPHLYAM